VSNDETDRSAQRRHLPLWLETVMLLAVALVVSVLIKTFFAQVFYVPSESMEPGLVKNDRILVEKPSYWFGGTPQRGDVVVFSDPGQWLTAEEDAGPTSTIGKALVKIGLYPAGGHLVKRVIGVAGDTIRCCDSQGRIEVNGQPLDEDSYLRSPQSLKCNGPEVNGCSRNWTVGPIPAGELFVLGDNRADSADSAYHLCHPRAPYCDRGGPFVPVSDVVGRVEALLWPAGRFHVLHRPATFARVPPSPPAASSVSR
jgi:signal peptidase I